MDATIRKIITAQGGVTSAQQLSAAGVSRHVLRRSVQRKELLRLPRGIILEPKTWTDLPPWDRHALRARGLMLGPLGRDGDTTALSHHSALALLNVSLFEVDDRVHVVRTDGLRNRSDQLIRAHASLPPDAIQLHEGIRIVRPAVAVAQVAATFGVESGLVSGDDCLRRGLISVDDLTAAVTIARLGNGRAAALQTLDHVDARSESAGETRCRWVFMLVGLPTPVPQAEIRDASGQLIARVDFLFERERVVAEFDGKVKYGRGQDLFAEKLREDALRALGYTVVRIVWADLAHPGRIQLRIQQAFDVSRRAGRFLSA